MAAKTTIKINADAGQAKKEIGSLNKSVESISGSAKKVALAAGAAFAGLSAAMVGATKVFSDFQNDMLAVKTLLDDDTFSDVGKNLDDGFKQMSKNTLKVFGQIPIELKAASKAMFDLVSAGVPASKATKALGVAGRLAVAGLTDVSTAVDGLTSVLNAYGYEAEDAETISGKMFLAQKKGKTTIAELASGFGKVGATARAMGVSFDEVVSSVSAMTLKGIGTREAYTGLKAVLAGISKPTAEAMAAAKDLGVEFNATALQSQGLEGFLKTLTSASGLTKNSIIELFGSTEAQNALFALTADSASSFGDILNTVSDDMVARQTVNAAYEKQVGSLSNQFILLKNNLQKAAIQIGEKLAPAFEVLVGKITELVDWFGDLDDDTQGMIANLLLAATAIAGVATAIATLASFLPSIISGFGILKTAFTGLAAVMAANPIGIAVAAIALAVTALNVDWTAAFKAMGESVTWLRKRMKTETDSIARLWRKMDSTLSRITIAGNKQRNAEQKKTGIAWLQEKSRISKAEHQKQADEEVEIAAKAAEKKAVEDERLSAESSEKIADNKKRWLADLAAEEKLTAEAKYDRETKALNDMLKAQKKAAKENTKAQKKAAKESSKFWSDVGDSILSAFSAVGGFFTSILDGSFVTEIEGMLDGLSSFSEKGFNLTGLTNSFDDIIAGFVDAFPKMVDEFVKAFPKLVKKIVDALPLIIETLANALPDIVGAIMEAIPLVIEKIPEMLDAFLAVVPEVLTKILEGLPAIITELFNAIPKIIESLVDAIPGIVEVLADNAAPIIEALILGIMDAAPRVIEALVTSLLIEGGLERIIVALVKGAARVGVAIASAFLAGLWDWVGELGQWFAAGFKAVFDEMVSWFGDFSTKQPQWMDDFFDAIRSLFSTPQWLRKLEELLNWLFDWDWPKPPSLGGGGDQWGSTGHKYLAQGQTPKPVYLADGWQPRSPDTQPAMIDPRERILSHDDNQTLIRKINELSENSKHAQEIRLTFAGDGAQKFVEAMLVEATALGTGRLAVAVGSED